MQGPSEQGAGSRRLAVVTLYVKLKVKLTVEQATKAQKESRDIYLYCVHNIGARWWSALLPGPCNPWKNPVPSV
jgi:hypothetical protein